VGGLGQIILRESKGRKEGEKCVVAHPLSPLFTPIMPPIFIINMQYNIPYNIAYISKPEFGDITITQ
jgi:hypothetical protein